MNATTLQSGKKNIKKQEKHKTPSNMHVDRLPWRDRDFFWLWSQNHPSRQYRRRIPVEKWTSFRRRIVATIFSTTRRWNDGCASYDVFWKVDLLTANPWNTVCTVFYTYFKMMASVCVLWNYVIFLAMRTMSLMTLFTIDHFSFVSIHYPYFYQLQWPFCHLQVFPGSLYSNLSTSSTTY